MSKADKYIDGLDKVDKDVYHKEIENLLAYIDRVRKELYFSDRGGRSLMTRVVEDIHNDENQLFNDVMNRVYGFNYFQTSVDEYHALFELLMDFAEETGRSFTDKFYHYYNANCIVRFNSSFYALQSVTIDTKIKYIMKSVAEKDIPYGVEVFDYEEFEEFMERFRTD